MARNLVVCCDGTANEFKKDRTNVLKLAFTLTKGPKTQLVYYHPGIGTMAPPGLFTSIGQWTARLVGKMFGYGLRSDIRNVYSFIMDHYQPGDRIFLFGFSRGAYTARAVTSLLHAYGLLSPGNSALVPYAIRLLWKYHRTHSDTEKAACFQLAREFREALSIGNCPIHFLGLWDTVNSVGWIANPLSLPYTHTLPDAGIIRHAVAIDERRAFFRTNLVARDPKRDIQEVWFPGVHCDVGGGYAEHESALSKVSLKWMIEEASKAGLKFNEARVRAILGKGGRYVSPDARAQMHNSLLPFWWLAEFLPKKHWNYRDGRSEWRPNFFKRRTFRTAPVIDDSAWERGPDYLRRLPADAVKRSEAPIKRATKRASRLNSAVKSSRVMQGDPE